MDDHALAAFLENRERELLSPVTRSDPARLHQLLHPDFREFGSSGQVFTRATIITLLLTEPPAALTLNSFTCTRVAPAVALLTYQSQNAGTTALRSSLWTETPAAGWQLLFHQGTRVPTA